MFLFTPGETKLTKCDQCHRSVQPKDTARIFERDRDGKQTGKVLRLCRDCEYQFFVREIKEKSNLSTDQRLGLSQWNKRKH